MFIALHPRLRAVCVVLYVGFALPVAFGQPAEMRGRPDDPLPPGALVRLRPAGRSYHDGVRAVAFSPDGKQLAAIGSDGQVRFWQTATGKEKEVDPVLRSFVPSALGYFPDGKTITIAVFGGVLFYEFHFGEVQPRTLKGTVPESTVSPSHPTGNDS